MGGFKCFMDRQPGQSCLQSWARAHKSSRCRTAMACPMLKRISYDFAMPAHFACDPWGRQPRPRNAPFTRPLAGQRQSRPTAWPVSSCTVRRLCCSGVPILPRTKAGKGPNWAPGGRDAGAVFRNPPMTWTQPLPKRLPPVPPRSKRPRPCSGVGIPAITPTRTAMSGKWRITRFGRWPKMAA